MDGPGFHVEPDVLDQAAQGMADTVAAQDTTGLDTLPGRPDRYGHDGVHTALTAFCDAWTVGVDALCDRSRWMSDSLRDCARAYRDADTHTATALRDGPVRADPALAEADPPVIPDR